ncbi:hypothetical protein MOBT1_003265 [Malassezia obtusa]|uniref:Calcineurin-like phosphoesterase domain-containing protein n=1 Tax=Malassezia obtusa TaxID=76774 RepID=A0AAF0E2R3_9BASI|nr:hypothetical protein MOBT1_003265 [Malassezia obtusa]
MSTHPPRGSVDDAERQPLQADAPHEIRTPPPRWTCWRIIRLTVLAVAALYAVGVCWPARSAPSHATTFTVPAAFPTHEFPGMDYMPTAQEGEPRPVITRTGGGRFDDALVDPLHLPTGAPRSDTVLPRPDGGRELTDAKKRRLRQESLQKLRDLFDSSASRCDKCLRALQYGQEVARAMPDMVPDMMVELCQQYRYTRGPSVERGCHGTYDAAQWGGPYTQMLSYVNTSTGSVPAALLCARFVAGSDCPAPPSPTLTPAFLQEWFKGQPTPPAHVVSRSKKTGARRDRPLRTLHVSDFHVDPRYLVGAEARCDSGECCRAGAFNSTLWNASHPAHHPLPRANLSEPARYWGSYHCDPPWALIAAGMQAISALIERDGPLDLGVFTGDLTTHDDHARISRDLVLYAEQAMLDMLARHVGNATIVAALGNHDYAPSDFAAVAGLPDGFGEQTRWNYEHLAALVEAHGWGNASTAEAIRTHHGSYAVSPRGGLRVISLNSDLWYKSNPMAYLHADEPDVGGMLRFLTDELQAAENAHERVWIVAHVLSGWDGSNALEAPTNLFYHIVSRYAHTIAHIFFGHTHEDQFQVYYRSTSGNASEVRRHTADAVAAAFVGPSLTPLNNVQPSLRVYEVDPETYEVMDYMQYYTPVDEFGQRRDAGPTWRLLYRARETYASFAASVRAKTYAAPVTLDAHGRWPASAPLNASFWAAVTDEMEARPALLELHHAYQSRKSPRAPPCATRACHAAKLCYMRSGCSALGRQCAPGYSSVQR